jgi:hypothetical protein
MQNNIGFTQACLPTTFDIIKAKAFCAIINFAEQDRLPLSAIPGFPLARRMIGVNAR